MNTNDARTHTGGSSATVLLRCTDCNQTKYSRIADLVRRGFTCDYCSDSVSFPNKIMRNLMLQLPVDELDFEYVSDWSNKKCYDAYFKYQDKKYLVEFDGEQHTKNTSWSTKEWQENNDSLKTSLAIQNGFNLIRIDARKSDFDFIKDKIMSSEFSQIFDLSQVDWNKIYDKALTNFNMEICEYYNKHNDMMLKDIAKHFHISTPTLTSALKKLAQLGLCDYSKEKAFQNGRKQCAKNRLGSGEPFSLYLDDIKIAEFRSVKLCVQYMQEHYEHSNLTQQCIKRLLYSGNQYKGYRCVYDIGLYEYHKKHNPLMFDACEMYNNNVSIKQIAEEVNKSVSVVYRYLNACKNMNLCDFKL